MQRADFHIVTIRLITADMKYFCNIWIRRHQPPLMSRQWWDILETKAGLDGLEPIWTVPASSLFSACLFKVEPGPLRAAAGGGEVPFTAGAPVSIGQM